MESAPKNFVCVGGTIKMGVIFQITDWQYGFYGNCEWTISDGEKAEIIGADMGQIVTIKGLKPGEASVSMKFTPPAGYPISQVITHTHTFTVFDVNLIVAGLNETNEEDPGAFISLNDDDDNGNQIQDLSENPVSGENDLETLTIAFNPPSVRESLNEGTLSLTRNANQLKIWKDSTKNTAQETFSWDMSNPDAVPPANLHVEGIKTGSSMIALTYVGFNTNRVDQAKVTTVDVDLKIGGLPEEWEAEPNEEKPGLLLALNDDDDNDNDVPDKDEAPVKKEDDLVQGTLVIKPSDLSIGKVTLTAPSGKIQAWTKKDKSGDEGNLLATGSKEWDLASEDISTPLFFEGIKMSDSAQDVDIELKFANGGCEVKDLVKATVAAIDLDVDSDNDGEIEVDDDEEDALEDDEDKPGYVICVNRMDDDPSNETADWEDDVPNGADDIAFDMGKISLRAGGLTGFADAEGAKVVLRSKGNVRIFDESNQELVPPEAGEVELPSTIVDKLENGLTLLLEGVTTGLEEITLSFMENDKTILEDSVFIRVMDFYPQAGASASTEVQSASAAMTALGAPVPMLAAANGVDYFETHEVKEIEGGKHVVVGNIMDNVPFNIIFKVDKTDIDKSGLLDDNGNPLFHVYDVEANMTYALLNEGSYLQLMALYSVFFGFYPPITYQTYLSYYNLKPNEVEKDLCFLSDNYVLSEDDNRERTLLFRSNSNNGTSGGRAILIMPKILIDDIKAISKNTTKDISVTLSPSSLNAEITLSITTVSGTGSATFSDGSSEKNMSESSTISIKGVMESNVSNNIKLFASINGMECTYKLFSVIKLNQVIGSLGSIDCFANNDHYYLGDLQEGVNSLDVELDYTPSDILYSNIPEDWSLAASTTGNLGFISDQDEPKVKGKIILSNDSWGTATFTGTGGDIVLEKSFTKYRLALNFIEGYNDIYVFKTSGYSRGAKLGASIVPSTIESEFPDINYNWEIKDGDAKITLETSGERKRFCAIKTRGYEKKYLSSSESDIVITLKWEMPGRYGSASIDENFSVLTCTKIHMERFETVVFNQGEKKWKLFYGLYDNLGRKMPSNIVDGLNVSEDWIKDIFPGLPTYGSTTVENSEFWDLLGGELIAPRTHIGTQIITLDHISGKHKVTIDATEPDQVQSGDITANGF